MPPFLTELSADILSKILNPDPETRYSIEDIRDHPWFNIIEHKPPYTPPIYLGDEPIPVDEKIIGTLVKDHQFEADKVKLDI